MANIKDLFSNFSSQNVLSSASLNDLDGRLESGDWIKSTIELQEQVEPHIDFSTASNFAFYGSAEQYYSDAFNYISNEYPYDGSGKEKNQWELSSSAFDRYIFRNEYPRTNGFVSIGIGTGSLTPNSSGYDTPANLEYIFFKGGPHATPNSGTVKLSSLMTSSNVYLADTNQQSNLKIDGSKGVTLEFWLKKQTYSDTNESRRQVICDIWNSGSWGSGDYGRLRVELSGSSTSMEPNFFVEFLSGSSGLSSGLTTTSDPTVIMSGSVLTGSSWNHFALSFANTGSQMVSKLYTNGNLTYTLVTGSSMGLVTGSMLGQIGSLLAPVSGNLGSRGSGVLSASLDEFRFWKASRTDEEVGLNWFGQVNGGTNTDYSKGYGAGTKYSFSNPVDLGVYFKFNEGITGDDRLDAKVLDYSGRVSNGEWQGYVAGARSVESAMVQASAASSEFKDPILYSSHPQVVAKLSSLKLSGSTHDVKNNASIYQSIPGWIRDHDEVNDRKILLKLTQIMASYFDSLQLQVQRLPHLKEINYSSSSFKALPFSNRLLESAGMTAPELFRDAKEFEYLASRDDYRAFSEKLNDVKNKIYQNVYNNLVHIYKSKGTHESFRNIIRCFGVGDELVRVNTYGDQVTSILRSNFESTVARKRYANFYQTGSFGASVFQTSSVGDSSTRSYLTSSSEATINGQTLEAEVIFPKVLERDNISFAHVPFTGSSLFGVHTVNVSNPDSYTWSSSDIANFQVRAVRLDNDERDAYFMLTSTAGGVLPLLTSSVFKDVYDETRWNISVRVKPSTGPWMDSVLGSNRTYDVEFAGYSTVLDSLDNSFKLTGSISNAQGSSFLSAGKRVFVGSHKSNFTGSTLQRSDAKISSARFWYSYLDDKTLLAHSRDPLNYGSMSPTNNAFLNQSGSGYASEVQEVPQIETLALQWEFAQVTGSNASGEFVVNDYSSGSLEETSSYGWISQLTNYLHPGRGYNFPSSFVDAISREYVQRARQLQPEILNSHDMVEVKTEQEIEISTRDTRPVRHFFVLEKSIYSVISDEMIRLFATVVDFNNLIGEPVNRYRPEYKQLEKARNLFFKKVRNQTIDFEKFLEYYKWIDQSIMTMVAQLFPASANYSNKMLNVLESHVLERNKYWSKIPTLEVKSATEAGLKGVNELLYPYERGRAPIPVSLTSSNCEWWAERAERTGVGTTSGDANVDQQRDKIRMIKHFRSGSGPTLSVSRASTSTTTTYEGQAYALRNFTKPYRFDASLAQEVKGGSNHPRSKKLGYAQSSLKVGSSNQLQISSANISYERSCNDIIDPNAKERLEHTVEDSRDNQGYVSGKGTLLSPFSLYSSSVATGYVSDVANNFRANTEISNYHDDVSETPAQGPFAEKNVGGRQHRHLPIVTSSATTALTRPEAWNLSLASSNLTITPRATSEAKAIYHRDEVAKRPINVRNIKWGTSSTDVGNYRFDYEVVQTSGRRMNNRYFVKSEGLLPSTASSTFVNGVIDYALPRFDLTGNNKSIIVERFSAPGGPEVSSRGALDLFGEEYSVYNGLNNRNTIVRSALDRWYTEHAGQFGIDPTGNVGDGSTPTEHATRACCYDGVIASYHKVNRNPKRVPAEGISTCSIDYDNWFVQHPIPQSDYQYAWINASTITSSCNDLFGHNGSPDAGRSNFTVPSGATSVTSSGPSFITSSVTGAQGANADFVGLNTLIREPFTSSNNTIGYPLSTAILNYRGEVSTLASDPGLVLNSLNLHRNGPYQHSSWKQIRTGEASVIRHQKQNNIISIGPFRNISKAPSGSAENLKESNLRGALEQHTEPPVTFKYRPLVTEVGSGDNSFSMRHSYGNNIEFFANDKVSTRLGIPTTLSNPGVENISSERQVLDLLMEQTGENRVNRLHYKEVIFPRSKNTGISKTRGRTQYAEVANGSFNADGTFSASVSSGVNGIDRVPNERRTFWRNSATLRNRRAGVFIDANDSPRITSSLPNSQGIRDGYATSINGWGQNPIVFMEPYMDYAAGATSHTLMGESLASPGMSYFEDCGELNSANYQTIAGYLGTATSGSTVGRIANQSFWYPTASCYFYHRQQHGVHGTWGYLGNIYRDARKLEMGTGSFSQMRWRVSELSGKNPWFDKYEDYVDDIRGIAKSFSIIPEFRMSQHMPYYVDGKYKKTNRKFLTLDGAEITSSANSETSGFNANFFEEYSHSDFQRYFGKFNSDFKSDKITLRCNAVKKLLPYNGFYPAHRSLQLASLFSQSVAPYVGGISWAEGQTTDTSNPPSGNLAVQSLLQPYFAPGILYNTFKSGIACDWAGYTGSAGAVVGSESPTALLVSESNYRIPFESILNPLEGIGIPQSSSNGQGKLTLLYPSYQYPANDSVLSSSVAGVGARAPFVDLQDDQRILAQGSSDYRLYRLAMSNFMAEIPSFFLGKEQFSSITSRPAGQVKSLVSGNVYFMDIFLQKTQDFVLYEDYWNGNRAGTTAFFEPGILGVPGLFGEQTSFNGKYFGPPVQAGAIDTSAATTYRYGTFVYSTGDPSYAPYTPPYYYGKSIATVAYTADQQDEDGGFTFEKMLSKATITYSNPTLDRAFNLLGDAYNPAASGSMNLSSSLNLLGLRQVQQTRVDKNSNLLEVVNDPDSKRNRWVISPKMETPILNFNNQPTEVGYGRGMWSGYGELLTGSSGIKMGIEETSKIGYAPGEGSLLQACFEMEENREIGKITEQKEISEAVVAIPFTAREIGLDSEDASTVNVMGKNMFAITEEKFQLYRDWYLRNKLADSKETLETPSVSVQNMITLMDKYVMPPELDFLTFNRGDKKVNPFVAYMFEFKHNLSDQELADIWQGVMPDISRTARLSNPDASEYHGGDNNVFSHPLGVNEFFEGKKIPSDIRWMIFKVKKKANQDYYKITSDTRDDNKLGTEFTVDGIEMPYTYNWPYDYFSLVELADIEVETELAPKEEEGE